MRRAIVHIGLPRTGTTTFQHVLCALRDGLAERGILYPDLKPRSALVPHLSHQYLGEALDGRRPPAERTELLDQLAGQLRGSDADVVLLSYEGLCRRRSVLRRGDAPQRLAAFFKDHGFTMDVLLTVKPQAEYLNSLYTLRTQWLLETRRFADYAQTQMHSATLDYAAVLRPWQRVCTGHVHLVPLRDRHFPDGLVPRIFAELGLQDRVATLLGRADLPRHDNASPGPVAVEACRRMAARRLRGPAGSSVWDITRFVQQQAEDRYRFNGVTQDMRARIEAAYADSNERLAALFWQTGWADRIGSGDSAVTELPDNAAPQEERVQALVNRTRQHFGLETANLAQTMRSWRTALAMPVAGRGKALH